MEILNATINIVFLLITFGFFVLYVVTFVLNLVRATTVLRKFKKEPLSVKAVVT